MAYMGLRSDAAVIDLPSQDHIAQKVAELCMAYVSNEVHSSMLQFDEPPWCYCKALGFPPLEALELMKKHWLVWLYLDEASLVDEVVYGCRRAITFMCFPALKLLYLFYEAAAFRQCSRGINHLRGLLWLFPDNKIVEDGHHQIRLKKKQHANMRARLQGMFFALLMSKILSGRELIHLGAISKDCSGSIRRVLN